MSDELLTYYNEELKFLRLMGAEFAVKHSKIAGRLRLSTDGSDDPHVERIIEAFAYLNARIRHKLDDDFPEIVDSLLGVLYPHYQNPIRERCSGVSPFNSQNRNFSGNAKYSDNRR